MQNQHLLLKTALLLTAALASLSLHAEIATGTHLPPAPLPEFKTPAQLDSWRAEMTAKAAKQDALNALVVGTTVTSTSTPFYTGKPYLAESGSYAFKFREYNPQMGRWTTVDPSGFPDGANNRVYAAVPTSQFDPNGFAKMSSYTGTLNWYDSNPRPETFTENFNDYYSDANYTPTDFSGFLDQFNSSSNGTKINQIAHTYNWGDAYAIGRGNMLLNGTVKIDAAGNKMFNGTVTLQNDTFDFDSKPWGQRSYANELLTRYLASTYFNPIFGGKPFDLTFSGSKSVSYE